MQRTMDVFQGLQGFSHMLSSILSQFFFAFDHLF